MQADRNWLVVNAYIKHDRRFNYLISCYNRSKILPINFLKMKYTSSDILQTLNNLNAPKIYISAEDIPEKIKSNIPAIWLKYISLYMEDDAVEEAMELWKPVAHLLPDTMDNLWSTVQGLVLLTEENHPPSLLYIFITHSGKLILYRGNQPLSKQDIPNHLSGIWNRLPKEVHNLYDIHNGWLTSRSLCGGHLPVQQWSFLSDSQWSLEPHNIIKMLIPPEQTLVVYESGTESCIGFEIPANEQELLIPVAFYYTQLGEMERVNFWEAFDEYTSPLFNEFVIPGT